MPSAFPRQDDFPWVAPLLRATIQRDLRRSLSGCWVYGALPERGAVLAANHTTWWDGYLLVQLGWEYGHSARIMMNAPELSRFPFLQRIGCTPPQRRRELARAAQGGEWVMIFPEGALQPAGPLAAIQPGAAWLARTAGVPLIPVALRVVSRAGRTPGAYLRFGLPCAPQDLARALQIELDALDRDLAATSPHLPPAGYLALWHGQRAEQRQTPASRLLTRLTGDQV